MLHPSFWPLRVLFRLSTCRPNRFGPSHRHRRRVIVDPSIRSQDTGRRNRASEISPRFLRHGRSHRLRTIGGNGKLFGRPGGMLWGKRLGGGGGVVCEGMFHEGAGGPCGMEREIIGL